MNPVAPNSDPAVTVDVVQKIKPGCEAEFEQVLQHSCLLKNL